MKLAVFVLCLMGLYCATEACSCFPTTDKGKLCKSDFVFKVKVKSSLINKNDQQDFDDYYKIKILSKYKNDKDDSVKGSNKKRIYTGTNSAMCGVYLTKGKTYLMSGTVSGGRQKIDSCGSWIQTTINKPALRLIKLLRKRPYLCKQIFPRPF